MYQQLRSPERLFRIGQWIVAALFAFFLIQVGASLIADLPLLTHAPQREDFVDKASAAEVAQAIAPKEMEFQRLQEKSYKLDKQRQQAQDDYDKEKASFDNWAATRQATELAANNPLVVAKAKKLDEELQKQRAIDAELQQIQALIKQQRQELQPLQAQQEVIEERANAAYARAVNHDSLMAFAIRLLFVVPLLAVAFWLFRRHRKGQQWPFVWGFIFFALFAFFIELVPYLPSFGGYIRYGVGAVLTYLGGKALMRALQRYLDKKRLEQEAPPEERQQDIGYEKAMQSLARDQCPSCERNMPAVEGAQRNYCMHCGFQTHTACGHCGLRHSIFFPYCPSCGTSRAAKAAATPSI